jgi:hypothetical protein
MASRRQIGANPSPSDFNVNISTVNGNVRAAPIVLKAEQRGQCWSRRPSTEGAACGLWRDDAYRLLVERVRRDLVRGLGK